jgi:GH15 family glucan-1,4-alpha-glucosidase
MAPAERYPPIADYGFIGDMRSCALVSTAGSIDWCCLPRFDSPSVFARLLDWENGGHFQIEVEGTTSVTRRYLPETMILETTFHTNDGVATLTDFMPLPDETHQQHQGHDGSTSESGAARHLIRILRCDEGTVRFSLQCRPRFDYARIAPHLERRADTIGIAHGRNQSGNYALRLSCSIPITIADDAFSARGTLRAGQRCFADLAYQAQPNSAAHDVDASHLQQSLDRTAAYWRAWAARCQYDGADRAEVVRSALTLKALTYAPSGALLAAPTTSLPERIGGDLNWDYRFTWIRDAAFTLDALLSLGYTDETAAFLDWLLRSTDGRVDNLQLMYGIRGERHLDETELPELEGYRGSRPVRIGNAAHGQVQHDVYGDVIDTAYRFHQHGGHIPEHLWAFLRDVADAALERWRDPDDGIWESRDGRQHFVYSKLICWLALDRAIKLAQERRLPADLDRWRSGRAAIRDDVLINGYDETLGSFIQAYGSQNLDAACLTLPLLGFISPDDPRMRSTVSAIQRELTAPQGLVYRNDMHGPLGSEGTFAICSFWLADNLVLQGDLDGARRLFDLVKSFANDIGLFSEQIDPASGAHLGNFPQAFSHLGHIRTAVNLQRANKELA